LPVAIDMSDAELQRTLREVRERVRVQLRSKMPQSIDERAPDPIAANLATLESLKANLSVIERSWNRLPPITTYRHGWIAQLELWLKRLSRKITYWFTWEQINFNSATGNSLGEVQRVLMSHEEALKEVRAQLEDLASTLERMQDEEATKRRKTHNENKDKTSLNTF
jgi:hypothetical protein